MVVFGVCWLPYHLYFLTTHYWPAVVSVPNIQHIYLAIYWLAMSNSMLNPIILLVMNTRWVHHLILFRFDNFPFRLPDVSGSMSTTSRLSFVWTFSSSPQRLISSILLPAPFFAVLFYSICKDSCFSNKKDAGNKWEGKENRNEVRCNWICPTKPIAVNPPFALFPSLSYLAISNSPHSMTS